MRRQQESWEASKDTGLPDCLTQKRLTNHRQDRTALSRQHRGGFIQPALYRRQL